MATHHNGLEQSSQETHWGKAVGALPDSDEFKGCTTAESDAQPQGEVGREYTIGSPVSLRNGKVTQIPGGRWCPVDADRETTALFPKGPRTPQVILTTCCVPPKTSEFILRATYKCGRVYREGGG